MHSCYGDKVSQVIKAHNFKSILSMGIGHGIVINEILEKAGGFLEEYLILEGSQKIIDKFIGHHGLPKTVEIRNSYFEDFNTNNKYNVIEMGFVLEHVDNPASFLKKYSTMIRPCGRLCIAVPNARSFHRLIGADAGLLDDIFSLSEHDIKIGHKRYFDLESLSKLLQEADLEIVTIHGIYLKPFSTSQIKQLQLSRAVMNSLCRIAENYPEISNAIYIEAKKYHEN